MVATVDEVVADQPVTIGRPIPTYSCWIVGEDLAPVPFGSQGELLIGGPGIAAGYLGRPDLTAQKFIVNPFDSDGSDPILYRSGDPVSLDAQGRILFHGRIDDQVKIRGFRVELGEIETVSPTRPASRRPPSCCARTPASRSSSPSSSRSLARPSIPARCAPH